MSVIKLIKKKKKNLLHKLHDTLPTASVKDLSPCLWLSDGQQVKSEVGTLNKTYKIDKSREGPQAAETFTAGQEIRGGHKQACPWGSLETPGLTGHPSPCPAAPRHPQASHLLRRTLIVHHAHGAVALVVGHSGTVGTVHRDLEIVGSQAVAVSVRIGEKAALRVQREQTLTMRSNRQKRNCPRTSLASVKHGAPQSPDWPPTEDQSFFSPTKWVLPNRTVLNLPHRAAKEPPIFTSLLDRNSFFPQTSECPGLNFLILGTSLATQGLRRQCKGDRCDPWLGN